MRLVFTLLWSFMAIMMTGQLMVRVTSVPPSTPLGSDIHISGSFNNFNVADKKYILNTDEDGSRTISLYPKVGDVEYKFTRGSWDTEEVDANGNSIPNRTYNYDGNPSIVNVAILAWEDLDGNQIIRKEDGSSNVSVLSHNFSMPQLKRERKIWIYLPPDYYSTTKNYPVIYLHDGQFAFSSSGSSKKVWNADKVMDRLFDEGDYGAIVVAVENGGWRKLDEFSPAYNEQVEAGGEGKAYLEFLAETLKPYVDASYRTIPSSEYTALIGSSMGGLISHYGSILYGDVFGKIAAISPSFWFVSSVDSDSRSASIGENNMYYLSAFSGDGNGLLKSVNSIYGILSKKYNSNSINKKIKQSKSISFLSEEFESAYRWFFKDVNYDEIYDFVNANPIIARPNPAGNELWIDNLGGITQAEAHVFSLDGKVARRYKIHPDHPIDISDLPEGIIVVKVLVQKHEIYSDKVVISRK